MKPEGRDNRPKKGTPPIVGCAGRTGFDEEVSIMAQLFPAQQFAMKQFSLLAGAAVRGFVA